MGNRTCQPRRLANEWHHFCKAKERFCCSRSVLENPVTVGGQPARRAGLFIIWLSGIMILLQFPALAVQSVTLAWDGSPDPSVVGYHVYYGTDSHDYTDMIAVGNATSATLSGLHEGVTYYFAVTAYDTLGLESVPSNEVSYTVPRIQLDIEPSPLQGFPYAVLVSSSGVIATAWSLQASPDLKTWRTLYAGTNSAVSVTVMTSNSPEMFFRVASQ